MRGRMVHEHDGAAALQLYGVRPEEVIYSVSRAELNRVLIEAADEMPNVAFRFGQLCLGLAHEKNVLEMRDEGTGHIYHTDRAAQHRHRRRRLAVCVTRWWRAKWRRCAKSRWITTTKSCTIPPRRWQSPRSR